MSEPILKLRNIALEREQEEELPPTIVTGHARAVFDVEKVARKFYERFKKQHADFLKCIQGIDLPNDREWYASVMLNRLMFVYFIQKKRFLDEDDQYLRNRLKRVQAQKGNGPFHDFYRHFLLRLFHEGLGQKPEDRASDLDALLGKVPYLNGGIFAPHVIEERQQSIQIPDEAFERIFDFFDQYQWHLDEQPLHDDREINPDVLGYIFEKYINQKEMGAYYTKEDITEYIGRNTILPYLFDAAQPECAIAFREDSSVWRLLQENPDRTIFDAMKKGVDLPLPANIKAGVQDVAKRGDWNKPAPEEYALPTEIWREVVARRQRYEEVKTRLAGGEIHGINDFITYNLDIRRFAQDVIAGCEGPELLRAFWKAIQSVRVLDPTVGSGAFLFAALNILEPLYEACLVRMEAFVGDADRAGSDHAGARFPDFRQVLQRIAAHPNRRHYIYKSIIVNNLFGLDIMEEATEICKLRLFLKLVAQVESVADLEPLPDIDFNIRVGNTLVGYAQMDDIERLWTATGRLALKRDRDKLERMAHEYALLLKDFRDQQLGLPVPRLVTKLDVEQAANTELRPELDKDLWRLYCTAGKVTDKMTLAQFCIMNSPLHWFVEFPEVMASGGFSVIIGNPPYVEYRLIKTEYNLLAGEYRSLPSDNLYAFCMEKATRLLKNSARFGMIVPAGVLGLDNSANLRAALLEVFCDNFCSTYSIRPSKLFDGVDQRLCIYLATQGTEQHSILTTKYHHWNAEERDDLFHLIRYKASFSHPRLKRVSQLGAEEAVGVLCKLEAKSARTIADYFAPDKHGYVLHYHRSPRYWIRAMDFEQYFKSQTRTRSVHHFRDLYLSSLAAGKVVGGLLNSSLFFFWFLSVGNGRNITGADVSQFPIGELDDAVLTEMPDIFDRLMEDFRRNSFVRIRQDCEFQEFRVSKSKPILDEIDRVLARHYGFTDEELDFLINYAIKYRTGGAAGPSAIDLHTP